MGRYLPKELMDRWERGEVTPDMAHGQLMQNVIKLDEDFIKVQTLLVEVQALLAKFNQRMMAEDKGERGGHTRRPRH